MTIIYMILCKSSNDCYIGRTLNLKYVKISYRSVYERDSNRKIYKFISSNGGIENLNH